MKKIVYLLLCLLFWSCSDEMLEENGLASSNHAGCSYVFSPEEAAYYALNVVNSIDSKGTRHERKVASVEVIGKTEKLTRGGESARADSLLYLVNFEGDDGFALISANKRASIPFYALSDEGNLNLADTLENRALATRMRAIYESASDSWVVDTVTWNVNPNPIIVPSPEENKLLQRVSPLLHYNVRSWNQRPPFNKYCFAPNGNNAMVGCTAVAVAMITSFYEWPIEYKGNIIDWTAIKSKYYANDSLYKFLSQLGSSENIDVQYGESSSGGSVSNVSRTFTNLGYNKNTGWTNYNPRVALSLLAGGNPLLVTGVSVEDASKGIVGSSHMWAIDGFVTYEHSPKSNPSSKSINNYIHIVWGWEAKGNGYFYDFGGYPFETDKYDTRPSYAVKYLYDKDLKLFCAFPPNK